MYLHLIGSAAPETVLELARSHPDGGVSTEPEALERFFAFTDFTHFLKVYGRVKLLVRTGADVRTLLDGLGGQLAAATVRYAEVQVTPVRNRMAGISFADLAQALADGGQRVAEQHGVELGWIFDADTALGPPGAAGLHALPHAGETVGPTEIVSALRNLGAERIGHGITAARDPALLEHLARHAIALEVCPTSNVCAGAVPSLAEHPLPTLLAAGVPVTVATDDPGLFATDLTSEYLLCHTQFGLGPLELAQLARTSARAAFCFEETRRALLSDIDQVVHAFGGLLG